MFSALHNFLAFFFPCCCCLLLAVVFSPPLLKSLRLPPLPWRLSCPLTLQREPLLALQALPLLPGHIASPRLFARENAHSLGTPRCGPESVRVTVRRPTHFRAISPSFFAFYYHHYHLPSPSPSRVTHRHQARYTEPHIVNIPRTPSARLPPKAGQPQSPPLILPRIQASRGRAVGLWS